ISLGQFAFVAVGAAVGGAFTSKLGWPFPVALLVASLVGALVAVLLGLPAMRIKGLFLAVTTLAFAVATSTVLLNQRYMGWLLPTEDLPRPKLLFINTQDERVYFYLCAAGLAFALWIARGIRRSRAGRVLIAMRDNERTAQAFSINRVRTRLATFAISGFLAAFAGVLLAHQQQVVRSTAFTPEQSVQIFLIAIIGGLGSLSGALLGALYIGIVNIFVPNTFGQLLASGVGVMLILLLYPSGLGGLVYSLRDAWLRRIAMRNRIFVPSLVGDYRVLSGERTLVPLAPSALSAGNGSSEEEKEVVYSLPSNIGVRGSSQAGRGWRWE
ncbi:MAG: branched-chain amino acid ABC transporter permease, partial [Acidimicrobiia bacterium]